MTASKSLLRRTKRPQTWRARRRGTRTRGGAVTGGARWRTVAGHADDATPAAPTSPPLRSEFERLLDTTGCPACSFLAEAEGSYFSWFVSENHAAASVQGALRASRHELPCPESDAWLRGPVQIDGRVLLGAHATSEGWADVEGQQ